jgi:hypothetical protein
MTCRHSSGLTGASVGAQCSSATAQCLNCGTPLGYEPHLGIVFSLAAAAKRDTWQRAGPGVPDGHAALYPRCANLNTAAACNWLVELNGDSAFTQPYCISCRLNRTIPDLSIPHNVLLWARLEDVKRRVISALVALGLPVKSRVSEDPARGLAFDLVRSPENGPRTLTGHNNGLITVNIEEADDLKREQIRTSSMRLSAHWSGTFGMKSGITTGIAWSRIHVGSMIFGRCLATSAPTTRQPCDETRMAQAVLALSASPAGFTASDLVRQAHSMSGQPESQYGPRRTAYDIKKLRAKGMVTKIGKSRRYEPAPEGLRSLTALLVLREKIIKPLLAASGQPQPASKPVNPIPLDHHYENLRAGMRGLFNELGLAA